MELNRSWDGRNVLITGVSGFIGSALCKRLVGLGANVVGVTNSRSPERLQCKTVVGDIANYELMADVISSNEIETVFHLAACAIVRISARDPMTTYRTNVMGTVAVLEAARNVGKCTHIVVASSDKAYGEHEELPYHESHPLQPRNTYDTSKACADMVARTYALNYSMPIVVTRSSNVYGPGDPSLSRIVPNTVRRVLAGKPPQIYSDIEHMEREFVFIEDVVDAYVLLGNTPLDGVAGEAYNIGGTGPMKISSLVAEIARSVNPRGTSSDHIDVVEREPSFREITRQYIDASKLFALTGWKPKTSFETGMAETIGYYRAKKFAKALRTIDPFEPYDGDR